MFLKRWSVIVLLGLMGIGLLGYWLTLGTVPDGVTPQSGAEGTAGTITVIAGAITSLGGAIFGILGKWNDFRKARLDIAAKELELAEKRQNLKAE